MKRRTFILTLVAAASGIVLTVFYSRKDDSKRRKLSIIDPMILSSFCDEQTLRDIGQSYRDTNPDENSRDKLMRFLTKGLNNGDKSSINDSEAINELELRIENEFKETDPLIIKGWVVSKTEARQCALLSLS